VTATDRVKIPNRQAAVERIVKHLVGELNANTLDELLGILPSDVNRLTEAELRRAGEASDMVAAKLRKMIGE
jgi:hypothetical protein